MEIKEFIELTESLGEIRLKGQLVLKNTDEEIKSDEVVGIATEDIKKGQIGVIKI